VEAFDAPLVLDCARTTPPASKTVPKTESNVFVFIFKISFTQIQSGGI
jgi:hypothetical protein